MKICLNSMGWMWNCPLLLILAVLAGCSHSPTISEGNLYLQAQSQQVQINTYKVQLQETKSRLTQVIPAVKNDHPTVPVSLIGDLRDFLANNDCTKMSGELKDACYKVTRVKLINVTRALDEANANTYASQMTVNQLITNINTLVDSMGQPDPPVGNLSSKKSQ